MTSELRCSNLKGGHVQRRVRGIDHGEAAKPINGISRVITQSEVGLCTGSQRDSVEDNQTVVKVVFDKLS